MKQTPLARDRAGKEYWDHSWTRGLLPTALDPTLPGILNHVGRRFDRYFRDLFSSNPHGSPRGRLLEVGCAQSIWLPYFKRYFDFEIAGLDYSEVGCSRTRQLFEKCGVDGTVTCADLFSPPAHMLGTFDVVFSNGVVEHFDDTSACVRAAARFLKPGGLIVTSIPNFAGGMGVIQKTLNKPVYDLHVPLDVERLAHAHEAAGLEQVRCDYFIFANTGVINIEGSPGRPWSKRAKRFAIKGLNALSLVAWWLDGDQGRLPSNRITSPYIICTGRRRL